MVSTIILAITFALVSIINGGAINHDPTNAIYDVPIPRGYTREEYFQSVVDYWTPERMAEAQPLEPVVTGRTQIPFTSDDASDKPEEVLSLSTRGVGARAAHPPAAGRIFFKLGNLQYVCSGSVVAADNRDTVVTAGHCVYNNTAKVWVTDLVFVPGYDSKDRPYGTFAARRLTTKEEWKAKVDYNNDVAIVLLNTNEQGKHAQDVVGSFGITLNAPKAAVTNAFGYPMNINSGETMSTCAGSTNAASILLLSSFKGIQIKCGMGGGASGGPWLQNYNSNTNAGQQVSLTSFAHTFAAGKINGPHFIEANIGSLYKANQNA